MEARTVVPHWGGECYRRPQRCEIKSNATTSDAVRLANATAVDTCAWAIYGGPGTELEFLQAFGGHFAAWAALRHSGPAAVEPSCGCGGQLLRAHWGCAANWRCGMLRAAFCAFWPWEPSVLPSLPVVRPTDPLPAFPACQSPPRLPFLPRLTDAILHLHHLHLLLILPLTTCCRRCSLAVVVVVTWP